MKLMIALAILTGFAASAETKVFKVGKMHCEDCAMEIKAKLCPEGKYLTCDVKLTNEKKELGEVKLVSKGDEKIDVKQVEQVIGDAGYVIRK